MIRHDSEETGSLHCFSEYESSNQTDSPTYEALANLKNSKDSTARRLFDELEEMLKTKEYSTNHVGKTTKQLENFQKCCNIIEPFAEKQRLQRIADDASPTTSLACPSTSRETVMDPQWPSTLAEPSEI
eukprot:Platyproteum_vivax@DN2043_c0_g1_i2.p1